MSPRLKSNPSPLESIPETGNEATTARSEPLTVKEMMAKVTWPARDPSPGERRLRSNPSPLSAIPENKAQQAPFRGRLTSDAAHLPQPPPDFIDEIGTTDEGAAIPAVPSGDNTDRSDDIKPKADYTPSNIDRRLERRKSVREQLAALRQQREPVVKKPLKRLQRPHVAPKPDGPSAIEERIKARKEKRQAEALAAEKASQRQPRHRPKPRHIRSARAAAEIGVMGPGALELRAQERKEKKARERKILEQILQEEQERQRRHRKTPSYMEPVYKPEPSQYSLKFQKNKSQLSVPKL